VLLPALIAGALLLWPGALLTAQTPLLTPLMVPASAEHHVGKVVLMELVTPDLAVAKQFYGGLLGWQFRDLTVAGQAYAEASLDGQSVGGLLQRPQGVGTARRPSVWLTYLAVRDVDITRALAVSQGAKVLPGGCRALNRARVEPESGLSLDANHSHIV
jgi:predicted enzyme related to lactoylglutathione lyase